MHLAMLSFSWKTQTRAIKVTHTTAALSRYEEKMKRFLNCPESFYSTFPIMKSRQPRADGSASQSHRPAGEWCCRWRSSPPSWPCAPAPCGGGGPAGRSGSPSASSPHWWPCVASLCGWSPAAWPRCSRMRAHNQESDEPGWCLEECSSQPEVVTNALLHFHKMANGALQNERIDWKQRCSSAAVATMASWQRGATKLNQHAVNTSCSFVIFCWLDRRVG